MADQIFNKANQLPVLNVGDIVGLVSQLNSKQPTLFPGENISIALDNTISALVPDVVQITGTSIADVMSQKAVTDELNKKANIFTYEGNSSFGVLKGLLYYISFGNTIAVSHNTLLFDYNDWCEFAFTNKQTGELTRTLFQWEVDEENENIYTLRINQSIGINEYTFDLVEYDTVSEELTWLAEEGILQLPGLVGFKIAGVVGSNWVESFVAVGSSAEDVDLSLLYLILKGTNGSINDSVVDLYQYVEDHDSDIIDLYDSKLDKGINASTNYAVYVADPEEAGNSLIQASSSQTPDTFILRDSTGRAKIVAPVADNDIANKKFVEDLISQGTSYRGQLSYVDHTTSTFPTTDISVGEKAFDISSNTEYIWNGTSWISYAIVTPNNGDRYNVTEYIPLNVSAQITYNATESNWDVFVQTVINPDDITINISSVGNFQIKDGGVSTVQLADSSITNNKIATGQNIINVNADWNATSGDALILNKPTNLVTTTQLNATNLRVTELEKSPTSGRLVGMTPTQCLQFISEWFAGTDKTNININAQTFDTTAT